MNVKKEPISLPPLIIKEEEEECDAPDVDPLHPPESPCCIFCFRGQSEKLSDGPALRDKIEFVLVARLQSIKVLCCRSCAKMFNLFYSFKKSCLTALSKKEELMQSLATKSAEQRCMETVAVRRPSSEIFKCSVCSKEFTDEDEHRYHINQHFGIKPFKCRLAGCKQSFPNPRDCCVHEAMCSLAPPTFKQCGMCAFRFASDAELEAHKVTHNEPQFKCSRCDEAFLFAIDCESHELSCRVQAHDPLQSIKQEVSLEDPDEVMSNNVPENSKKIEGDKLVKKVVERPTERLCKHCGQTFPLANRIYHRHQKKCSNNKIYPCSLCEKTFTKKMTLDTHMNKHKGVQAFKCRKPGCDKTFFGYPARYSHEEHCGTQGFICDICGDTLTSPGTLRIHRYKHDEPKFQCPSCDKRLKTKFSLQKHMTTHSDERNFECQTCGKRFKSYEANRVHQRIHTNEKPYACPHCDQRFTYNCSLKTHLEKRACLMN